MSNVPEILDMGSGAGQCFCPSPRFSERLVLIQKREEYSMRLSVVSSTLAAAFVLAPVAAGYAPAWCQDFSITNEAEPANPWHRDVMRQLQAWWDGHAYYPRHASNNDEGGTVKVHVTVLPDGRVWSMGVVASSGSPSLDAAGDAVFRGASVAPFPAGEPKVDLDISLHYVLAHRHDQPVPAGYTQVASKSPFTITNDPVASPILTTMVQRICTGTVVMGGIPNEPIYGVRAWAQAIFFRKSDGTPWVKFWDGGHVSLAPVTEVGKMVTWPSRRHGGRGDYWWYQITVWPDGDNHLRGAIGGRTATSSGVPLNANLAGNYVDLTCETEAQPTVTWNDWIAEQNWSMVFSPKDLSPVDPP
jgi:TonB family protein